MMDSWISAAILIATAGQSGATTWLSATGETNPTARLRLLRRGVETATPLIAARTRFDISCGTRGVVRADPLVSAIVVQFVAGSVVPSIAIVVDVGCTTGWWASVLPLVIDPAILSGGGTPLLTLSLTGGRSPLSLSLTGRRAALALGLLARCGAPLSLSTGGLTSLALCLPGRGGAPLGLAG